MLQAEIKAKRDARDLALRNKKRQVAF